MIKRRAPHSGGKDTNKGVNERRIMFFDEHLCIFPLDRFAVWVHTEELAECGSGDGG